MRWVLTTAGILAAPLITLALLVKASVQHRAAYDLVNEYVPAARDVLAGHSPYHLAAIPGNEAFGYPPLAAFVTAPLTLLPPLGLQVAGSLLTLAAVLGALFLAGVRDVRCYLVVLGSSPLFSVVQTCNLVALVALFAAAAWRFRERPLASGVLLALAVALKLFAWPLLLVPLLARRRRASIVAAASAAAAVLVPWAAIGFAGLGGYPHFLSALERFERPHTYTLGALLGPALSWPVAQGVTLVAAAALLALMTLRRDDERLLLVLAIALALLLSPIVWIDSLVVVFVAVAVVRPRLGWPWVAPLGLWLVPAAWNGSPVQIAYALGLVAAVFVSTAASARVPARGRHALRRPGRAWRTPRARSTPA